MRVQEKSERLNKLLAQHLTSHEAEQILSLLYAEALDACETALDTSARHLLHATTHQTIQKLCDSLPELLPSAQYPELVRSLWRVLDAGLHRCIKDAGTRRQVYAQYQLRVQALQQSSYDIGGSGQ